MISVLHFVDIMIPLHAEQVAELSWRIQKMERNRIRCMINAELERTHSLLRVACG